MRFKAEYSQTLMISLVIGIGRFIHGQNEPLLNAEETNVTARSLVAGATGRSGHKLNANYTDRSLTFAGHPKSANNDDAKDELIEELDNSKSVVTELIGQVGVEAKAELSTTERVADVGNGVTSTTLLLAGHPKAFHGNPAKRETKDTRSPDFTSNINSYNPEDCDPNFMITNLSPNKVRFEWQHSNCTKDPKEVRYYDIVIRGTNQENYTFGFGGDAKHATISSGSSSTLERKPFTFTPCESYQATLKVVWQFPFATDEYFQEFIIPLNASYKPLRANNKKIQEKTGPGWISLTWDLSRACIYNRSSIRLEVTGGRDKPTPRIFELPLESCATWDSSDTKVTLNLTNSHQKCLEGWRWEPCTRYNLSLTQISPNRRLDGTAEVRTTVLSIRTPVEDPEQDAKIQDLQIVDEGTDWLLLRWKVPYCVSESRKAYNVFIETNEAWMPCWEAALSLDTIIRNSPKGGQRYHVQKISRCNQVLLTPCTTYNIRVRNEYNDPAFQKRDQLRSDVKGTTLPSSIEKFQMESPSLSELKLIWRISHCPNYPLLQYSLTLKADSRPATSFSMGIDPKCTAFSVGPAATDCGAQHTILPCTNYEFQLTPRFDRRPEKENGTHISYLTKFSAPGQYYALKNGSVGSQWAVLNFTLHPQCLRYVESVNLTLIPDTLGSSPTYLTAHSNCFPQASMDGAILLNLTNSRCFPDFCGYWSRIGHYSLKALPTLIPELASSTLGQPAQVETQIQLLRDNNTSILNATVAATGSLWIYLAWTPPSAYYGEFLDRNQAYILSLYENGEANNPCSVTSTLTTSSMNVSSIWCTNRNQTLDIKPCTEYYFQVKPQFSNADMNSKANWTRSHPEWTLPGPNQSHVQNLGVLNVSSTRVLLSWTPPMCSHFVQNYGLKLSDRDAGGKETLYVIVPLSCSTRRNELYWLPNDKCDSAISSNDNNVDELEPCTSYLAKVWPRQCANGKEGLLAYEVKEIYFNTTAARPGKIGSLHLAQATKTTLTVEWGNITKNARCLQSYVVILSKETGGSAQITYADKDVNRSTFHNLEPCTPYRITVRSFGEAGFEKVAHTFSTDELLPTDPPTNLTYSFLGASEVNLTWSPPNNSSECASFYHVEIFQVGPNGTKWYQGSRICNETNQYVSGLQSDTQYEFKVTVRTVIHSYESPSIVIELQTAQAEGLSLETLAYIGIPVVICSALAIVLIYLCCVKPPSSKQSSSIRCRLVPNSRDCTEGCPGGLASNEVPYCDSVYENLYDYPNTQPTPATNFAKVLRSFPSDNRADLSAEYENIELFSNENHTYESLAIRNENEDKNHYQEMLPCKLPSHLLEKEHIIQLVDEQPPARRNLSSPACFPASPWADGRLAPNPRDRTEGCVDALASYKVPERDSVYDYITTRPIPIEDFDKVLRTFVSDNCAVLNAEFEDIKLFSNDNHKHEALAIRDESENKDRYLNILPYEQSRVRLNSSEGKNGSYINASYIHGSQQGLTGYIATQDPKDNTISDFWRMIWEQDVRIIVMLSQIEQGDKTKCAQYWPDSSNQSQTYGNIYVSLAFVVDMGDYVIRDLEIEHGSSRRLVKQIQFCAWTAFGCPENPDVMLSFIEAVPSRKSNLCTESPIVVHCSAGVGRTGTFIALNSLLQEARTVSQVDVFSTVLKLRLYRMNMVQTESQYLFIYQCLAQFLKTRVGANTSLKVIHDTTQDGYLSPKMGFSLSTRGNQHSKRVAVARSKLASPSSSITHT